MYELMLTPQSSDYDGGYVQETLTEFTDTCKTEVPETQVLRAPDPYSGTVMGGNMEGQVRK
jgi:hypothetical protein